MIEQQLVVQIYYFSLIVSRLVGVFVLTPILGSNAIPRQLKIGLIVIFSVVLMSTIADKEGSIPNLYNMVFQLVTELSLGLIIGFILLLAFTVVQLAGEFIDRRMGFALANVMDPQHGSQVPLIGQFKNILATLIFLQINGHHRLLKLLAKSFELVKLGEVSSSVAFTKRLLRIIGDLFPLAFKVSLPIVGTLFVVDIAFGLVARTVPQMNIFVVGLPVKLFIGMIMLFIILPNYIDFLTEIFADSFQDLYNLLQLLGARGG
ncbi:flagellar biosynthetic protein FliR [Halanaerobaculum tunisiense]